MPKADDTTTELHTRQAVLSSLADRTGQEAKKPVASSLLSTSEHNKLLVVAIRNIEALSDYLPEWDDLVANTLEPNVFYEPWQLLPASRLLGTDSDLQVVLIFAESAQGKSCVDFFRWSGNDFTTVCPCASSASGVTSFVI
jgi:hypothetical protein